MRATVTGKPWKRAGGRSPASVDVLLTASQIVVSSPEGVHVAASLSDLTYVMNLFGALTIETDGGTLSLEAPKAERAPFAQELRDARRGSEISLRQHQLTPGQRSGPDSGTGEAPEPGWRDSRGGPTDAAGAFAPRRDSRIRRTVVGFLVGVVLAVPLGLAAPHVVGFFFAWVTAEFSSGPDELPGAVAIGITWFVWVAVPLCVAFLTSAETDAVEGAN